MGVVCFTTNAYAMYEYIPAILILEHMIVKRKQRTHYQTRNIHTKKWIPRKLSGKMGKHTCHTLPTVFLSDDKATHLLHYSAIRHQTR